MIGAAARACRLPTAVLGTALLVAALALTTGRALDVGSGTPVRAHWFLLLGVAVVTGVPLYPSFGLLDRTFPRARTVRAVRWTSLAVLVAASAAASFPVAGAEPVTWLLLLAAAGVLSAVVTIDKAWLVVLVVGGATVLWDHLSLRSPVSSLAHEIGLVGAGAALLGSGLVFVLAQGSGQSEG